MSTRQAGTSRVRLDQRRLFKLRQRFRTQLCGAGPVRTAAHHGQPLRPGLDYRLGRQRKLNVIGAFPADVVLMQTGAFVERLQWPPRRIRPHAAGSPGESGLRRMRAKRSGALEGFPLLQLRRRVGAMLAAGHDVTFIGQAGESGTRVMARRPVPRWGASSS